MMVFYCLGGIAFLPWGDLCDLRTTWFVISPHLAAVNQAQSTKIQLFGSGSLGLCAKEKSTLTIPKWNYMQVSYFIQSNHYISATLYNLSIIYKNSTYLVCNTTACESPTGIGTFFKVMPLFMTHSASLPRLNLHQVQIFPLASQFSSYPIHFIPYSWLHKTTFGPQQIWVRHPPWPANVSPQWLWLWHHKLMWICVNDVVQTITWVNIASQFNSQTLKNFNCM